MLRKTALLQVLILLLPVSAIAQSAQSGSPTSQPTDGGALLPGDVIRIDIWREEDLSGQFVVDEDGVVILPLLGAKQVLGISSNRLRGDLIEEYGVYLQNPSVNVTLLRRINVLGEVRVPGVYSVDATVSIAGLIARAQGLTPDGNAEDITILRNGEILRSDLAGSVVISEAGIRSGDQVIVGRRSWFSRNFSSVVGIVSIISNVILITTR